MSIKNFEDLRVLGPKRVILRLDLNESVDKHGKLLDDFRLRSSLPTIQELLKFGHQVYVVSHMGRPEGKVVKDLSLEPVARQLGEMLNFKFVSSDSELPTYPIPHLVFYSGDIRKQSIREKLKSDTGNKLVVLENIRFYSGEEDDDPALAEQLSELGDVFVDDAFAVTHRNASSMVGITKFLPSYPGPLLSREITALDFLLSSRIRKPFILLMGGIKITDKAQTLMNLGKRADKILIGGGLANLFLDAKGFNVGDHQIDVESRGLAKQTLLNFKDKIILPQDVVVECGEASSRGQIKAKKLLGLSSLDNIYDIGPKTILNYTEQLKGAGTICWNGPLGYFEDKKFRTGTMSLAKVLGGLGKRKAYVLAGGGETVAAIRQAGQLDNFDHVSTGGGAMLEYLAGNHMPGIEALQKN